MQPTGHPGEWEQEKQPQLALVRLQQFITLTLTAMRLLCPPLCGHPDPPQPLFFVQQMVQDQT